jgi:hypothetical protein
VMCGCYSAYLSSRDYAEFSELFGNFKVQYMIQYNTFSELCEAFLNDSKVRFK